MRQRFGIAVALVGNPRLIIVDEPTAGLDPAERARFLNLLSELGENAVVILSTHIVEDVSDLCTRMAVIAGGRILLEGQPARAVEALRGHIWRRQVDRAELPRFEQAMPVISTTLAAGRTVIHVYADVPPDPTFEPVEPDLKDVYFTLIRGIRIPQPYGVSDIPPSDGNVMGVGRPSPGTSAATETDADTAVSADDGIPRADVAPGPDPATASSGDGGAAPPPIASVARIEDRPAAVDRPMAVDQPRAGPGAAHVPRFADVGEDVRAGVAREDGDAGEAPRADADVRGDGEAA
jgi:hypothetical protein